MNANGKTNEQVQDFLDELFALYRRHDMTVRGLALRVDRLGPCEGLHLERNPDRSLTLHEHMRRPEPAPCRIITSPHHEDGDRD